MKPGVTARPSASISRVPRSRMAPTCAMRSPTIPTSARYEPKPDPSTTTPLRITRSNGIVRHYAAMAGRFAGRIALVTGAAGGIGTATSRLFAAEDARVVCVDLDGGAAAATAAAIVAEG